MKKIFTLILAIIFVLCSCPITNAGQRRSYLNRMYLEPAADLKDYGCKNRTGTLRYQQRKKYTIQRGGLVSGDLQRPMGGNYIYYEDD